ncbi:MAG: class I SAM-dependent methyltransferase, partial [Bauldia sp.]|nr:class I SAM-dependent methyltransferase [Bauldia sp.]
MNRMLDSYVQKLVRTGTLELVDAQGHTKTYGDGTGKPIRLRFTRKSAERNIMLNPGLKFGEEFMDGGFVFDQGSMYDFLELIFASLKDRFPTKWMEFGAKLRFATRRLRQANNQRKARRNVAHHYDLDGRLYSLFLDNDQQYSCAYFEPGETDLEVAQLAKKRHLASKLALKPGQKVLDIGSGWG